MGSDKWKKKKGEGKRRSDGGGGKDEEKEVVKDARFASVHTDPRFQKIPTRERKVTIDSRFDKMFTDRSFGSSAAPVDKKGRRKEQRTENPLKRYYELEDEKHSDEEEEKEEDKRRVKVADEEEEAVSSSYDELDELSDIEVDTDDDEIMLRASESDSDEQDKVPETDQETSRLAAVNLDWHHIKAVDLYALLNSFLPDGGRIRSVTVYPSEFGTERMKEEAVHGPIGLFDNDDKKSIKENINDEHGSDSDVQIGNAESEDVSGSKDDNKDGDADQSEDGNEGDEVEDDGEEEVDEEEVEEDEDEDKDYIAERVRNYEKTRLRYFFAVVCCDSVATANHLYKECDGIEIMQSSNKLDLRYIPDAMEFKREARDIATELPSGYNPSNFFTKALQLSKPVLTWDEDEPGRATLKRNFNADELEQLEFNELLASDLSDSDDDDDSVDSKHLAKKPDKEALRSLLLADGEEEDDDDGLDMEVTFNTGLEDISKRILGRREKKSLDLDSESDDGKGTNVFFGDGPPLKKHKADAKTKLTKKGKDSIEVNKEAASREELELLVADDKGTDSTVKGYKIKPEKTKGKKKGMVFVDDQKIPEPDLNDPRFQSLFKNPLFALDPTDPQFKRSVAYRRQLADRQRKADQVEELPAEEHRWSNETQMPSVNSSSKPVISSLVKSIKMKSKNADKSAKSNMSLAAQSLKTKTKHLLH